MKATRCTIDDCDRIGKIVRGMCGMHYDRMRRRGTVALPSIHSPAERLAVGLVAMPNGCLEWTGYIEDGYGRMRRGDKVVRTHRLAWEFVNGSIPDGLDVLHHCDNRPCCQTDPTPGYPEGHLFLGTHADNNADRDAKGRCRAGIVNTAKTHCPQGHPYAGENLRVVRGGRQCKTCIRARDRVRSARKRKAA